MKLSRTFWMSAAATAAVVTTVVTGVSVASAHGTQARPATVAAATSRQPAAPAAAAENLGKMIHTGLDATPFSEWVIKAVPVKISGSKKKTFGFAIYDQKNEGQLVEYMVVSEETAGKELKTGFHGTENVYGYEDGMVQPAYGYFVGKPAKITGLVDGKSVKAKTAKWSVDSKVTVFWFDNTTVTADSHLTSVSAYDAAGARLAKARVYSEADCTC